MKLLASLVLTVFTHPACSGCPEAVRAAWEFTESREDVELRTVTLAEKAGLEKARAERVTVIPTLMLSRGDEEISRWQGFPPATDLEEAVLAGTERVPA